MTPPKANSSDKLYNRVAVLRVDRSLSRAELADAIGVNYQTLGYMERGEFNPSLEVAFRLSEFFGLPIEAIFSRTPFEPISKQIAANHLAAMGKEQP